MTITLFVQQEGEAEAYIIGTVTPPATVADDDTDAALDALWEEWREEEPTPDADSEFVAWLVEKGWREVESYGQHTFHT